MPLARRRTWLAVGWVLLLAVVVLSLMPPPLAGDTEGQLDKLGHLAAYTALMLWFGQIERGRAWRAACALGLSVLGVALEFAQRATGYRSFELMDMVANCAGVGLGALLLATPLGRGLAALEARLT